MASEWIKFKSKDGKKLCKAAINAGCYINTLNYDLLAVTFPDALQQNKNIDELQKEFLKMPGISKNGEKLGRPTAADNNETRKEIVYSMLRSKNGDFSPELKEKYNVDVIADDDIYINMLAETVNDVKLQFFAENADLIKKHPSIWFRNLCNEIRKNSPKYLNYNKPELIKKTWSLYSDLCMEVCINRTIENFQIFTGLNWNDIEKIKEGSSPDYIELAKIIYSCCRADLVGGLSSSFGSNTNQIFIAKSVYGIVENTVVTHVSKSDHGKNIDDIPCFNVIND